MKRKAHKQRMAWTVAWVVSVFVVASARAGESAASLRDLERRALQAQALVDEVRNLRERLEKTEQTLRETEARVAELQEQWAEQREEMDRLTETVEEREREVALRDRLLRLFRSGAFEYYQVQDGDSLKKIAGNPMVYGDEKRAVWIAQANGIPEDQPLREGMVLVIPRYSEGVSYDF